MATANSPPRAEPYLKTAFPTRTLQLARHAMAPKLRASANSAPRRALLQLSQASARGVGRGPRYLGDTYAESRAVFVAESNRRPGVVFELCRRRLSTTLSASKAEPHPFLSRRRRCGHPSCNVLETAFPPCPCSERNPRIGEDRIVALCVMRAAEIRPVEIVGSAVEVQILRELDAEADVRGRVGERRAVTEGDVGEVEDQAIAERTGFIAVGNAPSPSGKQGAAGEPYSLQSLEPLMLK